MMFQKLTENDIQEIRDGIQSYLSGFSVETTSKGVPKVDHSQILPQNTPVYITHLPGEKPEKTADAAVKLRDEGMVPIPHIGARNTKGFNDLEKFFHLLSERAGVDDVLLIGGGSKTPLGDLTETMDVLKSGFLENHGIKRVGLAGHPEGSPDFSDETALKALQDKVAYAREIGIEPRVLTQFLFKAAPVKAWGEEIKDQHGLTVPVHVGLAGPTNVKQLVAYAKMCGVGASMKVLTRNPLNYLRYLSRPYTPAHMVLTLARYAQAHPDSNLTAPPHFYSLGGIKRCGRWLTALQEGAFEVKNNRMGGVKLDVDWS